MNSEAPWATWPSHNMNLKLYDEGLLQQISVAGCEALQDGTQVSP